MFKIAIFFVLGLFLVVVPGCYSAREIQRSAINRARDYAIENLHDLNENQVHFVRYAAPEFITAPLFTRLAITSQVTFNTMVGAPMSSEESLNSYKEQKNTLYYGNFVWILPETNEVVIVSGTARKSMRYFDPVRAVRRPIVFGDPAKYNAVKKVRNYVLQDVLRIYNSRPDDLAQDLDYDDWNKSILNRVRFAPPMVYASSFMPAEDIPEDYKEYTMVWRGERPSDIFCVTIYATTDFRNVKIVSAQLRPRSVIPPDVEQIRNFGEIRTDEEQHKAYQEYGAV